MPHSPSFRFCLPQNEPCPNKIERNRIKLDRKQAQRKPQSTENRGCPFQSHTSKIRWHLKLIRKYFIQKMDCRKHGFYFQQWSPIYHRNTADSIVCNFRSKISVGFSARRPPVHSEMEIDGPEKHWERAKFDLKQWRFCDFLCVWVVVLWFGSLQTLVMNWDRGF